jgi:hypothetical protein
MSAKKWFVHIGGETFGPASTESIITMIKQFRLHFADYIWAEGFTKWVRVSEVDDFIGQMPAYPKVPIPSLNETPSQEAAEETEEEPPPPPPKKKVKAEPPPPKAAKVKHAKVPVPTPEEEAEEAKPSAKAPEAKKAPKVWPKARRFIRVEISGGVDTPEHGKFNVVDISPGGVFVKSEKPLDIGTELKFTLQSDAFENTLEMTGVVIRHGTSYGAKGFAIEFTRLNPSYRRLFQEYVENNGPKDEGVEEE